MSEKNCYNQLGNTTWNLKIIAKALPDIPNYGNVHFDNEGGIWGSDTPVQGVTNIPIPIFPVTSTTWTGQYKKYPVQKENIVLL